MVWSQVKYSNSDGSFIMSFKTASQAYNKYAGVLCEFLLQLGIMLGTVLEIPYAEILGIN